MIQTWSDTRADTFMSEDALLEAYGSVCRHPWWEARAKLVIAIMGKYRVDTSASVLDVGCGWGVNLSALERAGYRASGLDVSRRVLELIDRPERTLIQADVTVDNPTRWHTFDVVLALDVIEHMEDDGAGVAGLRRLLGKGGLAIISVPALPELFSEFDQIQGHWRRYLPTDLAGVIEAKEFALEEVFWWGAWMVPILKRIRMHKRKSADSAAAAYAKYVRPPTWPLPVIMRMLFAWEQRRALDGRLLRGTSLFAVARAV